MSLTLFFMSLMLYAQSESFTFEENVKTGKITNWNYQGQIIVITCSGYWFRPLLIGLFLQTVKYT